MWHIYRTLTSDVTSDFSGNVANKFKVKLNLRLPGDGWKVSIISAIVPKMALFKDWEKRDIKLISLFGNTVKNGGTDTSTEGYVKTTDLPAMEKSEVSTTAKDFFNAVRHKVDETAHGKMGGGYKFSREWTHLTWDKNGAQPEMILNSASMNNRLFVEKTFANLMGWTVTDASGNISLGANLVPDYPTLEKGNSSLGNGETHKVSFVDWIQLNSLTDWRFINLEQSFKDALNLHARPLTVSAKVTSGTGASKVTYDQPMSHVYYAPQGRERYLTW